MKPIPVTAEGLIEELLEDFPARCIRKGESLEEAHRYAGKRELVEYLAHRLETTEDR